MITTKQQLKEWLEYEEKIYNPGKKKYIPVLFNEFQIIYRMLYFLRKAEYAHNFKSKIMEIYYRFRLNRIQNKFALHIPMNVCKKGLSIAHLGPIIINKETKIGENCRIHVGVNIGANGGGSPVIGNDVYIGPGAKIFGDITIADNVRIGANAVVNKSCDIEGCTLVGVPAKAVIRGER
ncbi:serine acetyltransferase [Beduinella massiliensis]|uniref:serine acetyltransferase n=1 Tax=Beduinella massiliensis TaxID=1852363 RepID=UPI000C816AEC